MKLTHKILVFILLLAGIILLFGDVEGGLFIQSLVQYWLVLISTKVIGLACFALLVKILNKQINEEWDENDKSMKMN